MEQEQREPAAPDEGRGEEAMTQRVSSVEPVSSEPLELEPTRIDSSAAFARAIAHARLERSQLPAIERLAAALRGGELDARTAMARLVERAASLAPADIRPALCALLAGLVEHDPTLVAMRHDVERAAP